MQLIPLLHLPARSAAMLQTMQAATRLSSTGRRATRSAFKVVTPTGDIVDVGSRLQKCPTGLALEQLFAGSEGTLGIITEITVKLRPLPPYSFNMVCVFKTDEEAFALPDKILKAGVDPTSLEYMDNEAIIMTEKYLDMHFPHA